MTIRSNSIGRLHLRRITTTRASGDTWVVDRLLQSVALRIEVVVRV
jgi:hypothetical protein